MANYSSLISAMEAVIRQNGNQQITGTILQTVLRSVILELGAEFQFGGVATPDTNPNTPDYNVAYIAGAGTYTNFDNQTIPTGKIGIFKNRGAELGTWALQTFDISLGANSVSESNIQNGAVTENKIADNSVSTDKIKNKNVTRNKLSDGLIDELDKKANVNGFYSTLGAGVAENLVGRGSVPAEYTFRPSGGNADLGSGTAQIKKLMGRTLVWNQLADIQTNNMAFVGATATITNGFITMQNGSYEGEHSVTIKHNTINNHKYLVAYEIENLDAVDKTLILGLAPSHGGPAIYESINASAKATFKSITTAISDKIYCLGVRESSASGQLKWRGFTIDLTLMFGAGNEPSTVEEFEALFPLPYYAYNEGELLSVKATGIKTVGFNQWDEQWESGIWTEQGKAANDNFTRCKNYIPIFPNTKYYIKSNEGIFVQIWDKNYNYISDYGSSNLQNSEITTPANAAYLTFWYYDNTIVLGSICINLSWSGYRNGEYEPYWESELPIPITTMTGKLNGEGESVVIFPDGLKSAGNVYDEIVGNKAIKRVGKVDLGTLNYMLGTRPSGTFMYSFELTSLIKKPTSDNVAANVICSQFVTYSNTNSENLGIGLSVNVNGTLYIFTSETDPIAFKTAMSGVYLYYELATPEEYILDAEQPMNYRVDDFGTEMELPQNDDEPITAPIRYEVQYAMNAVDTLRRLPENYISKESFEDFLAEFDSKLGAALNATIVSTMTFNAETQKYGFNITITPNP